jgi:hypothetical protein
MAETKTINLEVNADLKSLKQQFKEAQNEVNALSEKFGATSKEAVKAAKAAADLKDRIGDAKALTDAFNPDAKFKSLTASIGGAAGGFSAFQGAMGLVGAESKNVEAALLKVQSAMALSQGLQQLGEARDSFKQLGAVAKSVFTGMKGAIAATGIGVLLIALGAIAANWDSIKGAIGGVTEKQQALTRETQKDLDLQKSKLARLNQQDNALRLQGATEREILVLKIAQTKQVADAGLKQIEAAKRNRDEQIEATAISRENLSNILKFIEYPITTILKAVDKVRSVMGQKSTLSKDFTDFQAGLIFNEEKVRKEADKGIRAIREENQKVIAEQQALEVQLRGIDKQAAADRLAIKKQATLDLEAQRADEAEKNQLAYQNKVASDIFEEEQMNALNQREIDATKAKNEAKLKDEDDARIFLNGIKAKQEADDIANAEREKARLSKQKEDRYNGVKNGLAAINDLTFLFAGKSLAQQKKAFQVQKAVSIAQTLIDTYKSATAAFSSLAGTGPQGVVLGGIAAAAAIASGLANVKRISATQFDSGGGGGGSTPSTGGGGGGGGGAPTSGSVTNTVTPNFNIVGANGQNQLNGAMQPIQAYVVSSDITTQQQLDRNKIRNATL